MTALPNTSNAIEIESSRFLCEQFIYNSHAVQEGDGFVTITVSRTLGNVANGSVIFATSSGTATAGIDYTEVSGTLNFGPAETTKTFIVPILNDALDELSETINLTLSSPTGFTLGGLTSSVVDIGDNDPQPTISIDDVTVGEGDSGFIDAQFMLRLSAPSGRAVSVRFNTLGGSASFPSDYQFVSSLQVTLNPGETTKAVPVRIFGDTEVESNELIVAGLSVPRMG